MENSTIGSDMCIACNVIACIAFNIFVKNPPRVDCWDICDIDIFISLYFMLIVFSCVSLCLSI